MTQEEDIKITLLISQLNKLASRDSLPSDTEKLADWCQKIGAIPMKPTSQGPAPTIHPGAKPYRGDQPLVQPDAAPAASPGMPENLLPWSAANSAHGTVNPKTVGADILRASQGDPEGAVDPAYVQQMLETNQIAAAGPRNLELRRGLQSPGGVALKSDPNVPVQAAGPGGSLVAAKPPATDTEKLLAYLNDHQAEIASGLTGAGIGRVTQPDSPHAGIFGGIAGGLGGRLAFQKLMELAGPYLAASPAAQTIMNFGVGPALTAAGSMLGASGAAKLVNKPKPQADPIKQRQLELYRSLAQATGRRAA